MTPRELIDFTTFIGKLKTTYRHCYTAENRPESVADHSWRIALMAMLCKDEFPEVDIDKVIKMCLVHDFGEAVTGDIPAFYKTEEHEDTEEKAIDKLLKRLPAPVEKELSALFDEMEKLEAEYKDADDKVQAEYEGDKASYDLANVSYFYFDSTDETAQDKADAIVEKVKGGMDFAAAIVEVSGNADATPVDRLTGETKSVISGNFSSEAADWVFEIKDGNYVNGNGAVTTLVVDDVVYVLYADNSPSKNEAVPATVNYIKVEVGTDTTVKTEDELKLSAKASATKILAEFENGEKTEAAFTKLQDDCNSGDDTLVTGDTFSAIVAGDANDDAVDAWVFDSARKVSDYALVEGDGCYYILFYTSVNEHPVWYQTALNVILEEARTAWDEQVKAEFEDKTVVYDEAIEEAIAYITSSAQ